MANERSKSVLTADQKRAIAPFERRIRSTPGYPRGYNEEYIRKMRDILRLSPANLQQLLATSSLYKSS